MTVKTKVLRNEKFLSILFDIIGNNCFVCGGYARESISKRPFDRDFIWSDDVDVYAKNEVEFEKIVKAVEEKFKKKYENSVAVCFDTSRIFGEGRRDLQIIKPIFANESVEAVIERFDFTVCRAGIWRVDNGFDTMLSAVCDEDFDEDDLKNRLVIKNIHCPISEVNRIHKYRKKGYDIAMSEIVKIFRDWDNRDQEWKDNLIALIDKEKPSSEDIEKTERLLHLD